MPQTFDPALAAAPPETDVVRAMYEGLTEYDSRTLTPLPGVALKWTSNAAADEWTFHLRRDARWSTGEPVTAQDFVNSWKRTLRLGTNAPHVRLMENIAGALPSPATNGGATAPSTDTTQTPAANQPAEKKETKADAKREKKQEAAPPQLPPPFGVEALDDYTLRVRLVRPDVSFPALVAHPVFRPVHNAESQQPEPQQAQRPVTNGAFQLERAGRDGVTLERAQSYWDAQSVGLQRVQFVAAQNVEAALSAYRAGEVDAVTNAGFEPLAVKLLAPYRDFRRATYGALTFYSFNTSNAPFTDVRVREALAIVIDRDRICDDEMGGATEPAKKFLPEPEASKASAATNQKPGLEKDVARAQSLLAAAGFPQGKGFPPIRLLINRNEQQRMVAQSIAAMWKTALGLETDIISKNWDEYEAAVRAGDYDVVRRGFVMQTTDEATNMRLMFETGMDASLAGESANSAAENVENPAGTNESAARSVREEKGQPERMPPLVPSISSESQALRELPAFPVYFASSYALVKPYVNGFDANLLDAPSLKRVRIDTGWRQQKQTGVVWFKSE